MPSKAEMQTLRLAEGGSTVNSIVDATGLSPYRVRSILEKAGRLVVGARGPQSYRKALKHKEEIVRLRKLQYDYKDIAKMLGDPDISFQIVGRIIRTYAPNLAGMRHQTQTIRLNKTQFTSLREVADRCGESSINAMMDRLIVEALEVTEPV
jgi:hypothetical protein